MDGSFVTIIMAAGIGKRMNSDLPKVLHKLNDKPIIHFVIETARNSGAERILLVIGYKREMVREATAEMGVEWIVQENQLGTGDAIRVCEESLEGYSGHILILSGDVPLLKPTTIERAWRLHRQRDNVMTLLTFKPDNPKGYGRIIRGNEDELIRIVEHADATEEELNIGEVNAGIYFFKAADLFSALSEIDNKNVSGEYYLTDTISAFSHRGDRMAAFLVDDPLEVAGVNTVEQLSSLELELTARIDN